MSLNGRAITLGSNIFVNDADGVTVDATSLPGGLTINGGCTNRIFLNNTGCTLSLIGLTLTAGNGTGIFQLTDGLGGAINNRAGTLTLT